MKRILALALSLAMIFVVPVLRAQTNSTNLSISAHWDDNSAIQGTVTLSQVNPSGSTTAITTGKLTNGSTSVNETLAANAVYGVVLKASNGTELLDIPFTTAMINPNNLANAQIAIVMRAADHSVESARVEVYLKF